MPKVSIIVPNYNHGKYLRQRLDSIFSQTITDIEVFILDDCSTDNSWEIIQEYSQKPQVNYIHRNNENSGSPFIQWQKGIQLAKGEYIWIAESDDYASEFFLEKHLEILEKDKSIGLSFCPSIWIDLNDKIIDKPSFESDAFIKAGSEMIIDDFTKGCKIYNASSALFRKNLVENVDFQLINTFRFTGDWQFWVQLIQYSNVCRIAERLNFFRRHHENVSTKSNKKGLQFSEGFKVVNYILKNYNLGFMQKHKIYMIWALKVDENKDVDKKVALSLLPNHVKFWYNFLPIIKLIS